VAVVAVAALAILLTRLLSPQSGGDAATEEPTTTTAPESTTTTTTAVDLSPQGLYLASVRAQAPELNNVDEGTLVDLAEVTCRGVAAGLPGEAQVLTFASGFEEVMSSDRASAVAVAITSSALGIYCPDVQAPTATIPPTTIAPTTTLGQPIQVSRVSGSTDTETDTFTVSGTWEISWTVTGGAGASVTVRSPDGSTIDYVSIDPGQASSQLRQGCTCYLEISTFGATYDVEVTDLPG
jgi:hypothetical protein